TPPSPSAASTRPRRAASSTAMAARSPGSTRRAEPPRCSAATAIRAAVSPWPTAPFSGAGTGGQRRPTDEGLRRDGRERPRSAVAIDDQAVRRIVRRNGHGHPIARNHLDVVAAHAATDLGGKFLPLLGFDPEETTTHHFLDRTFDLN